MITALQDFVHNIPVLLAMDNKLNRIGLFMDLSKAYDVLDHKLLLNKLNLYGISGTANLWIVIFNQQETICRAEQFKTR
jgi:hypothetical protein